MIEQEARVINIKGDQLVLEAETQRILQTNP